MSDGKPTVLSLPEMNEITPVQQDHAEATKRWLSSDYDDLYIWWDEAGLLAFEYCYDKTGYERDLRWHREQGWLHAAIDNGDNPGGHKRSPMVVANDPPDSAKIRDRQIIDRFHGPIPVLTAEVKDAIQEKLEEWLRETEQ